jgi:ribosomal protein L30E
VSVDYATVEGSARAGQDFVPSKGTLVFSKGEVAKCVYVAIHDDDDYKEDMTFFVQLSNVRATTANGKVRTVTP